MSHGDILAEVVGGSRPQPGQTIDKLPHTGAGNHVSAAVNHWQGAIGKVTRVAEIIRHSPWSRYRTPGSGWHWPVG